MIAAIDLGDGLAQIATALRVPVLIAAVLALLLCALELGRFGAERWRRFRSGRFELSELTEQAIADPPHAAHYAGYAPGPIAAAAVVGIAAAPAAERGRATEHALAGYELAVKLGYLRVPPGMITKVQDIVRLPDHQAVILCTGSQGEINSALTRMSTGDHPQIKI